MRDSVHFRYKLSWIDLRGDGMFDKEQLKGKVKKIYQRDTRRRIQRETIDEIRQNS